MSDHHPIMPPSSAAALLECCEFRGGGRETPEMARGTLIDRAVRELVERADPVALREISEADLAVAQRAAKWVRAKMPNAICQDRLKIFAVTGEVDEISFGTVDFHDPRWVIVADLKTGEKRDVTAQLNLYALGAMQVDDADACGCAVLWADHDEVEEWEVTRADAEALADEVRRAAYDKPTPPRECQYCAWCSRRDSGCPIWSHRASQAIQVRPVDEIVGTLAQKKLAQIAESPELTGAFLVAWDAACKAVEGAKLREKAREWIAAGTPVPGWKVRPSPGRESVSVARVREWAGREGIALPEDLIVTGENGVALIRDIPRKQKGESK